MLKTAGMQIPSQTVKDIGEAIVDSLLARIDEQMPSQYLAILVRDPDWLDRLIPEAEAASFLGVEVSTCQSWRVKAAGPPFVRPSARLVRYRRRDLISWANAHLVSSTSEPIGSPSSSRSAAHQKETRGNGTDCRPGGFSR